MTPEEMAALHARAFAGQGRGWRAGEIRALLESGHVLAVSRPGGFALIRIVADEGELLTIASDPELRRQGIGRALLAEAESVAHAQGAARMMLEVACDNAAALALYARAGYCQSACRKRYYARPDGRRADALILEKDLCKSGV